MSDRTQPAEVCGYAIRRESWEIAGQRFNFTWPADIDALLELPITHARFERDEYMPYWAQPWPASVLLAEAVLRGEPGCGRTAIELGCGIGVVSLAAAAAGWSVYATDYDHDAVAFAAHNASQNGLTLAGAAVLDYRHASLPSAFDLILGSDLLYERRNAEPIAAWLASNLKPDSRAMISDPNRSAAEGFPEIAARVGLEVDCQDVETTAPVGLLNRGRIWTVRLRQA